MAKKPKKPTKNKLTPKQLLFCKEYLVDLNATQAAIRAGYSKKTAQEIGAENLSKPIIKEFINKNIEKRVEKIEINADKVLQELAKMAFSNMLDYITIAPDGGAFVDFSKLTKEQAAAIQEVTTEEFIDRSVSEDGKRVRKVKFKLADKKGTLELLGKHLKLFDDKNLNVEGDLIINYAHRNKKSKPEKEH